MKQLLKLFSDLIFPEPSSCVICHKQITVNLQNHTKQSDYIERVRSDLQDIVCGRCFQELKFIGGGCCDRCGRLMDNNSDTHGRTMNDGGGQLCRDCIEIAKRNFVSNRSAVVYNEMTQDLIHRFKYRGQRELAELLAVMMDNAFKFYYGAINIDKIIPVPLHEERLAERGFNQAAIMSKKLAARLNVPLDITSLQRVKNTIKQSKKNKFERIQPLDGVFEIIDVEIDNSVNGDIFTNKNILLVDDIYTTGTTVDGCAKVLKDAGAKKVYVLTLAR